MKAKDAQEPQEKPRVIRVDDAGQPTVIKLPTERRVLTLDFAKELSEMPRSPQERKREPSHVKKLQAELSPWPTQDFAWALALFMSVWYRVNGQHTSYIYAQGLLPIPEGCYVSLALYECARKSDISWLWNKLDHRSGGRTGPQMVAAWAAAFEELNSVVYGVPNAVLTGICLASGQWESTADNTERKIQENLPLILFVNRIVAPYAQRGNKFKPILLRVAVQAAMYQTWQHDPEAAEVFWSAVASGDSYVNSPTRACREYLLSTTVASGYGTRAGNSDVAAVMKEKCIFCWNAWRKGRKSLTTIRLPADGTALEVL